MNAGVIGVGAFALIVGGWLYWHKDAPRFTVLCFLLGGMVISGLLGGLLGGLLDGAIGALGTTTSRLFGIGAATIVAALGTVLCLEVIIKGLGLKIGKRGGRGAGAGAIGAGGRAGGGGTTKRYHPWLALALPTVVVTTGVPLIATLLGVLQQAAGSVPVAALGG